MFLAKKIQTGKATEISKQKIQKQAKKYYTVKIKKV